MGLRSCALLGKSCQPLEFCAPPHVLGDDELPCLQSHTFGLARAVATLASCRRVADQHLPRYRPGTTHEYIFPLSIQLVEKSAKGSGSFVLTDGSRGAFAAAG